MLDYVVLIELAKKCGFTEAGPLDVSTLECMTEVRDMCLGCPSYDKFWACPPGCGSLDEMCDKINKYSNGLLVQTVGPLEDSFDWDNMQQSIINQDECFQKLRNELTCLYPGLMAISAGNCTQCESCTYTDGQPCRFPDRQTASMEAYGLLVGKVCSDNNIRYNYGPNTIAQTGCFLLE